jgi:hypothetical protein
MESKRPPLTVAIDFDGTLCDACFPDIGTIKEGAREALQFFKDLGYRIIIYSCRTCHWHHDIFGGSVDEPSMERTTVRQMVAWLDSNGLPYDLVDDGSRGKVVADYYIDDKAIRFDNNWPEIQFFVGVSHAASN